jgi:hypothetical protein
MKTDAEVAAIVEQNWQRARAEQEAAITDARLKAQPVTRGDILLMLAAMGDGANVPAVLRLMKQRWGITR